MMIRSGFCLVLCLLLLPGVVLGAAKKGEPPPDERKLVSAVNLAKKTIDITHQAHKITTTYVVAADAVILINGKTSTLKDVKVGLQLFALQLGTGMDDPPVLEELELKTAAPKPK